MKRRIIGVLIFISFIIVGALGGYYLGRYMPEVTIKEVVIFVVWLPMSFLISIIIHEGGHYLFGKLTGYKFVSFRVLSYMLVKIDGKIKFTKYSLPGTGGQCLMAPPKVEDKKEVPYFWYNFGGGLVNIFATLIVYVLFLNGTNHIVILFFGFLNLVLGVSNLIPINDKITNDGYNILNLYKKPETRKYFYDMLAINAALLEGKRMKELPGEYFEIPSSDLIKTNMGAQGLLYYLARLIDEHKFIEGRIIIQKILEESNMIDLQKDTVKMELIYFDLLDGNYSSMEKYYDKNLEKLATQLGKYIPAAQRVLYVVEKLYNKNEEKAQEHYVNFEKIAKEYPYRGDVVLEKELMELALAKEI